MVYKESETNFYFYSKPMFFRPNYTLKHLNGFFRFIRKKNHLHNMYQNVPQPS